MEQHTVTTVESALALHFLILPLSDDVHVISDSAMFVMNSERVRH